MAIFRLLSTLPSWTTTAEPGRRRIAHQAAKHFDRLLLKLEPTHAATPAEQRLWQRVQRLCSDADGVLSRAESESNSANRSKLLLERLRVTGKALGDCLTEAVAIRSLPIAKNIFASYQERFSPRTFHYNALLSISPRPLGVLKQMLAQRIAPDQKTFLFLFRSAQSQGEFQHAFRLLCQSTTGLRLDVVTYTALICAAERCEGVQVADSIFRDADCCHVQPDAVMIAVLIRMHAKARNYDRCRQLHATARSLQLKLDDAIEALMRQIRRKSTDER